MNFLSTHLERLADMICGSDAGESVFKYRSSRYLTRFFQDCGTDFIHLGESRHPWVMDKLREILREPQPNPATPGATFARVVQVLMQQLDAQNEEASRPGALKQLNVVLATQGFEAFYSNDDQQCYLRHLATNTVATPGANPHRPFTPDEIKRRDILLDFLSGASEDEVTESLLLPLFRRLGFQRITAAGHKDKALEYGKDIWMKFALPTLHMLYFGVQVKKEKLDAAADSVSNVSTIYNQVNMMLGHEIFDSETSKRGLVDHAFIISCGEITKAARNWIGERLDISKRSQIMFMDRNDIVNLCVVNGISAPAKESDELRALDDSIPF